MARRRRRNGSPAEISYAELRALNVAGARQKLLEAYEQLGSIRAVARAWATGWNSPAGLKGSRACRISCVSQTHWS